MVLYCGGSEHPVAVQFDGGENTDVNQYIFLFMFGIVITRGKEDGYSAIEFMCHLKGATFYL